jgi:HSP20 family molecular chaperone IbpA
MAIEEHKKKSIMEQIKAEKPKLKYQVQPKYGAWMEDEERLVIEVVLPGIKKENIQIKSLKDYFTLRATRDDIQYNLDLELNMEIVPEKTTAKYEEGLLHIELYRFNPLETAFIVPVNGKSHSFCESKENKEDDDQYWILPDVTREIDYDNNKVELEIALPGVKEDQICLKVLPDWFNLIAKRDKQEYRANSGFGTEIVPEKTTAEYFNGLLKIHGVIHNEMDDAKRISIN